MASNSVRLIGGAVRGCTWIRIGRRARAGEALHALVGISKGCNDRTRVLPACQSSGSGITLNQERFQKPCSAAQWSQCAPTSLVLPRYKDGIITAKADIGSRVRACRATKAKVLNALARDMRPRPVVLSCAVA